MSAALYKVIHIAAVLYVFTAIGGLMIHAVDRVKADSGRKLAGMTHGLALLVVLISGFGLMAGLQTGMQLWIWLKLGVWLAVGASIAAIRRMPGQARLLWLLLPLLGTVAAYLAIYKPTA